MDVFDLVYQIRMELEEARLSGHQVHGLREQMMHRLRSRAADDETTRDAAAAASSAAVDERLQKQKRELKERMNRKLEKQKLEHQRLVEGIREEQLDADSKRNKTVGKVEGFLTNLQKHMSDELKKVSLTLKDTGGTNGMRQSSMEDLDDDVLNHSTSSVSSTSALNHSSDDNGLTNLFQNLSQSTARLKQVNAQLCSKLVSARRENVRLADDEFHSTTHASTLKENLDSCMTENARLKAELNASRAQISELSARLETERLNEKDIESQLAEMLSASGGGVERLNSVDAAEQAKVAKLQLELKRAEYRASVAEQCFEQTKLMLNEKLIQVTDLQSTRMF